MKCSIEGCDTKARCRGWCQRHYMSWYQYGDPLHSKPDSTLPAPGRDCTVSGCGNRRLSPRFAYCSTHYNRLRTTGSLEARPQQGWWLDGFGYVMTQRPGHPLADKNGHAYEHRVALWEKTNGCDQDCYWCGRSLRWFGPKGPSKLTVDHVDWDKTNNTPANLVASCTPCNGGRKEVRPIIRNLKDA